MKCFLKHYCDVNSVSSTISIHKAHMFVKRILIKTYLMIKHITPCSKLSFEENEIKFKQKKNSIMVSYVVIFICINHIYMFITIY